jgi:hypothetical protein
VAQQAPTADDHVRVLQSSATDIGRGSTYNPVCARFTSAGQPPTLFTYPLNLAAPARLLPILPPVHMSTPAIKVYASRDFRSYRPVASPVAAIAQRFYTFATGTAPECAHARYAYATAYLGQEPPMGAPFAGSPLDEAVRTMLLSPPVIVLAQGPMQPWGLFGPEREAERQSVASTGSGNLVIEPVSAVCPSSSLYQKSPDNPRTRYFSRGRCTKRSRTRSTPTTRRISPRPHSSSWLA